MEITHHKPVTSIQEHSIAPSCRSFFASKSKRNSACRISARRIDTHGALCLCRGVHRAADVLVDFPAPWELWEEPRETSVGPLCAAKAGRPVLQIHKRIPRYTHYDPAPLSLPIHQMTIEETSWLDYRMGSITLWMQGSSLLTRPFARSSYSEASTFPHFDFTGKAFWGLTCLSYNVLSIFQH